MTNLIFGLIWTTITFICTLPVLFEGEIGVMLFLSFFWIIGIYLIKSGLKEIRTNKATDNFGEECFGIITDIYETGTYVNDVPELKADIKAYIPSLLETISVSEKLGLAHKAGEYDIGTYVLLKYYNGDVNIVYSVDEAILPADAKYELEKIAPQKTSVQDTIILDGVEYVRKR